MLHTWPDRLLIFGNSGAGKSTLARRLVETTNRAHLDLDPLAWRPTDPPTRTPLTEVVPTIKAFATTHAAWVIEGCYADVLRGATEWANGLIFLDLPVSVCQAHARQRPWEPHKYPSRAAQDAKLDMLLAWIAAYPDRDGPLSRPAHMRLYAQFDGWKRHLTQPL